MLNFSAILTIGSDGFENGEVEANRLFMQAKTKIAEFDDTATKALQTSDNGLTYLI